MGDALGLAGIAGLFDGDDEATTVSRRGLANLFALPDVPLLPQPAPPLPPPAPETVEVRRGVRLGAKSQMPVMHKAIRVLCKKMGVDMEEELPIVTARKEYEAYYKNQLPTMSVNAISHISSRKCQVLMLRLRRWWPWLVPGARSSPQSLTRRSLFDAGCCLLLLFALPVILRFATKLC